MNREPSRIRLVATRVERGFVALLAALMLVAVGLPALEAPAGAAGDPCAPVVSKVACENSKPGDVSPPDDHLDAAIEGFTTQESVNPGQTVHFKIRTSAPAYSLDIYRVGWYDGVGGRKVATVTPSAALPQIQPDCLTDATTGLVDCGDWAESAAWNVPSDAVSGVYVAYLIRPGTSAVNEIVFVVRDDSSHASVLVQTSDTTWQAYNQWGGNSLYFGSTQAGGAQPGRAYKVSYNRPLDHGDVKNDFWASEVQMVHFLERNGYDVSYQSGLDTDRLGASVIEQHKTFMSSGHDEYWSGAQRDNVQAARDAGVNLAFFSGNQMFWKTRWEPSIDGSNTDGRTLVTYKETLANAKIDPNAQWTGTFRDPRFSPPADGGQPENALTGNIFTVNGDRNNDALSVSQKYAGLRQWKNTSVASQPVGGQVTFPVGTLGYEWNSDLDNGFRPPGNFDVSSTTVNLGTGTYLIGDFGSNYTGGTATHSMTMYKAASGARVFNSGTVQWSWGIDSSMPQANTDMMQATVNILADLDAQPATLQAGLVAATKTTDTTGPTTTITAPSAGATVNTPQGVTVTGTATDSGGGVVAGVEVSTDGTTWHPAQGTTSWSYTWVPPASGSATIRARAVDDSANIGAATTRNVTSALACPCSLFSATAVPTTPSSGEGGSLELGMRFRPDIDGVVTGVRFYKGAGNAGTHTGSLWTEGGQLLTTVTFSGETASGWQQASFPTPVAVNAGTTYVISYHAPLGNYAADPFAFSQTGIDRGVLHAPADWSGGNGVFAYGDTSLFPGSSYNGTNYWVDVVFNSNGGAPTVLSKTPPPGTTALPVSTVATATFSKAVLPATIAFTLKDAANTAVPGSVSYNSGTYTATFTPTAALGAGLTFTASVSGATDSSGNTMSPVSWSFTTAGLTGCPCTIWPVTATPGTASADDSNSVELGTRFTADATGTITGVRFYKGAGNTGTHTGTLWSASGQQLATATFTGETASGWQSATFSSPVPVSANTQYVVSYHAPNGHYAADSNAFAGSGVDNAPLHAPANTASAANGVYNYSSTTSFPNQTWQSTNYWVDVSFNPGGSGPGDTTPPSVTTTTPVAGATGVSISATPTATFGEAVQAGTVVFTLKDSSNATVAGTTSYSAATNVATFTPAAGLAAGAVYNASVSGAKDTAGNVMVGAATWSFTTAAPTPCCSLWSDATVPGTASVDDPNSVELGVRFTADVAGVVNGVRFYKGAGNTGTHTGSLWSASGQQLATATFSGETGTGWQEVTFSSPVTVAADTQYIVSYHAPNGNYAADGGFFQAGGTDNGSLHAPANSGSAGNGVYAYGSSTTFPDQTWNSTNYWVDVLFAPSAPADTTAPTVTTKVPAASATGVAISAAPSVTFSEPVQASTVAFTLKNAANVTIAGTTAYNPATNTSTFSPTAPLANNTVYTASVTGAKDTAGNTMAGTTTWSFTTAPDTTAPVVSATTPVSGATGVAVNVAPTVTFNETMQATTGTFTMKNAANTNIPGTITINPALTTATFTPSAALANGTVYTLSVAGAKDAAGNTMVGTTSWSFTTIAAADTTAPTVTTMTPAANATGVALSVAPTATFSEPVQAATIGFTMKNAANTNIPGTVTYSSGTNTATFTPNAALANGTVYTVSVTGAKDTAGNTMAGTTTRSFTTLVLSTTVTDTTTADFTAGTQSSTSVTETADGEVELAPTVSSEFSGTALPSGWTSTTNATGGTTTVAGGKVTVNGTRVGTSSTYSVGRNLEAKATFATGTANQNVGFATTLASGTPWAVFGTKSDGNLYARSQSSSSSVTETNLGTTYLNAPHVFRVEWNLTTVVYKVDGVQVASHSRSILTSMRPIVSELTTGGSSLSADWVRMGPYASTGTFTSRVFNATRSVAWGAVSWTATAPAGSSVVVKVRSGNVATPNGSWTAFTTVTNGGTVLATAQYRQYQVTITRASDGSSPNLSTLSQIYTG